VLIFGLLGTYRLVRRSWRMKTTTDLTDIALALWLIVSLALAGMRGGGFAHYIVPVVPPLVLLAAVEIDLAYRHWKTTSLRKYAALGAGVFVVLIVVNFIWTTDDLYGPYLSYKLGRISHESFLRAVSMDGYASQAVANYLKTNTAPDDFVYIWSIYVDVYYYADRTPPIDILWPSYVAATGSPERIFDPRTKYIVLDTPKRMDRPQWLLDGLAAKYRLETTIEGREIYRRTTP
jgi:4-amino-4-deoxy-L-arabinose transferase-like glycosyltransferase